MILKYRDFNKWAHDYYLSRFKKNTKGNLCIDAGDIDDFLQLYDNDSSIDTIFHFKQIISDDWSALLREDPNNSIPYYFGLIALQCYAASKMENSEDINAKDYQKRFKFLVGLPSTSKLQQRFSEEVGNELKVQEDIWMQSLKYLSKHGIGISIPENKKNKGRYTQFPLSQVILNAEDLKDYIPIFRNLPIHETPIDKSYFLEEFRDLAYLHSFERPRNKSLDWKENNELAELQIFNFFCGNWQNIIYPVNAEINKTAFTKKNDQVEIDLFLIKRSDIYEFYHRTCLNFY